jgi:16S rRNA (adenine1518-N6/adenine1519-N6)-dimethyltransferase
VKRPERAAQSASESERGWGPASAKKRFSQHFLEPAWADKLLAAIDPRPGDRFLEIGPGPGALTDRLAPRVAELITVEVDRRMVAALEARLPAHAHVVEQDFLAFDLSPLLTRGPLRVAGNLPYNVTSPILFKLLNARRAHDTLTDATLMVQREVADRIEGRPGTKDYGTLSIFVQLRATVRRVLSLPPGAFRPAPKVHSAVLRIEFRPPAAAMRDEATFERLVRSIFTQRRKTLSNALRSFAEERGVDVRRALAAASVDGTRRPETLQVTELAQLADVFHAQTRRAVL